MAVLTIGAIGEYQFGASQKMSKGQIFSFQKNEKMFPVIQSILVYSLLAEKHLVKSKKNQKLFIFTLKKIFTARYYRI